MENYLKTDYAGAYSGIKYGKKGDKVNVIREDFEMALVESNGQQFHVRIDKLSDVPVEVDEVIEIEKKKVKQIIKSVPATKKTLTKTEKQTNLF